MTVEVLTEREKAAVVHRIRSLVEFWGITPEELANEAVPVTTLPAHETPRPIKYRHPVSGETWDGQGPHPDWLREALLKQGFTVEELRPPAQAE